MTVKQHGGQQKERDIKTSEYNGTQYVIQVIKSPIF